MAVQKKDDQHERTFSNYVRIRDVVQKTCLKRCTIGKSGERGSGRSVLAARHDNDDDDDLEEMLEHVHLNIQQICIENKVTQGKANISVEWGYFIVLA